MKAELRILLCGGGTGGHIYPLVAVAEAIADLRPQLPTPLTIHYFGSRDQLASELARAGVEVHSILVGKLRRYASLRNLIDIPKFFIGFFQAWGKMFSLMPDVIFSKGGPGALPVVLCGWFYHIPIIIHESDSTPGLTTLLTARFARHIMLSFESAKPYFDPNKSLLVGNPIRKSFRNVTLSREEAKDRLGFNPSQPLAVVLGGSQGSKRINEFIALNLKILLGETQILHQTGSEHFLATKKLSEAVLVDVPVQTELAHRYLLFPYLETQQMVQSLAAADVVVGRAGSGMLFEVAAFGKPSILIPLDGAARDHQRANAYALAEKGCALVIEEENLNPQIFTHELKKILGNPATQDAMSRAALQFAKPGAAEEIAEKLLSLAL